MEALLDRLAKKTNMYKMGTLSAKKEFIMNLRPDIYQRSLKREVAGLFVKEWNEVYQAMIKDQSKRVKVGNTKETKAKGIKSIAERKRWFWPRFYNLVAAKYKVELRHSSDGLYFLAKRITEVEIEKSPTKWAERFEMVKQFFDVTLAA